MNWCQVLQDAGCDLRIPVAILAVSDDGIIAEAGNCSKSYV
jgi:hypothetical protein